jgi:hypothetical protein
LKSNSNNEEKMIMGYVRNIAAEEPPLVFPTWNFGEESHTVQEEEERITCNAPKANPHRAVLQRVNVASAERPYVPPVMNFSTKGKYDY